MYDSEMMGGADAGQRLLEPGDRLLHGKRPVAPHDVLNILAIDVFHHHHSVAVLDQERVQHGDIGVHEVGLGPGLGAEALDNVRIVRQVGVQYLDRHPALELHLERAVYRTHAALAELLFDEIVANLRSDHIRLDYPTADECGAGWKPAADCQSACPGMQTGSERFRTVRLVAALHGRLRGVVNGCSKPIDKRPQVSNLPPPTT